MSSDIRTKSEQTTGISLGRALANSGRINERRIFQLIRADRTADMVQLRRLLTHAEPVLDWPLMARMLTWWGKRERQQLLEDFVLTTNKMRKETFLCLTLSIFMF